MAASLDRLLDPKVTRHLIADEGEIVVDEVRRHWAAHAVPTLEVVAGIGLAVWALWWPVDLAWVPLVLFLGLVGHGLARIVAVHMDRFVITNMRVFRVHGIFSRHTATMPMARILDITVDKPLIGRILGYGHFVFESAAQAQGLREIRYVGRPDERDLTIQRVIQRSGLRASMKPTKEDH